MRQVSMRFQFPSKIGRRLKSLLPWIGKLGARAVSRIGALVMGKVYSLDSKQEQLDGSPLECDEITYDEHTDNVASLLEDNARLRKLVIKLSEIILRNVADGEWRAAADP